jgi:NAD(P) transhydrogenase subunit alpha
MIIGIPRETRALETRVAATPETVKKLAASGKHSVVVGEGAGVMSSIPDADFAAAGASIVSADEALGADIVLKVRGPSADELPKLKRGAMLIGLLNPFNAAGLQSYAGTGVSGFSLEKLPRITRAQSMDVLSSQANIAGYKAVIVAANEYGRFMPMLMTAAGTVKAARVLILGVGVAGLQAIATAKRLGAVVEAYDVRSATREQVKSLGAKFVETGVSAEGTGGYARELTEEEKAKQQEVLEARIAVADAVISTAAIPGRRAPRIISRAAVERMKAGAVIIDMAAESGGNCELTVAGQTVVHQGVKIVGPVNLPAQLAFHASEMYARNLYNFLKPALGKDAALAIDWQDEVFAQSCLTHAGTIKHEPTRKLVEAT